MKLINNVKRIFVVAVVAASMGLAIAGPTSAALPGNPNVPAPMYGDGQEGHGKG